MSKPNSKSVLERQHDIHDPIVICGVSLDHLPKTVQISIVLTGIFTFYIMYSFLQEYLFVSYEGFNFGFFTTLIQFIAYSTFSGIEYFRKDRSKAVNYRTYFLVAFLSVTSMGLGYQALSYLSYPTKILFKSSKLLGVMIIGVIFLRKSYKKMDYLASLCIFIGLYLIFYGSSSASTDLNKPSNFDIRGVILMVCAISADSLVGNLQEDLLHFEKVEAVELIFFSHSIGIVYLFVLCTVTGQFQKPIEYCVNYPSIILVMLTISICGYFGVQFVHSMTKLYGILYTVTATSIRKVLTILLSFVFFPKPWTISYLFAIGFVFAGTFIKIKK
jgi:adenosine 3'-phospho 5'-phosphosulfate transporter B3